MQVEYISHYGDDDMVASAARVSFDKDASNYTEEQNTRLIKYLANHEHNAPFFHPQITLRETVPIFISRQRFKHSVGFAYSEVSRRYVDDTPEFYQPDVWRKRAENVKQGSSDEVYNDDDRGIDLEARLSYIYNDIQDLYSDMIDVGIAPEQARMVLPQSMYTSYYVTGSLYAFARAYLLRADPHAQKEIRDVAAEWDRLIRPHYPVAWSALVDD